MTGIPAGNANEDVRKPVFVRATGHGSGGIATLMLDGYGVKSLLKPRVKSKRDLFEAQTGDLIFARLVNSAGALIDEVVLAPIGRTETATGNEQIEMSCHGGAGSVGAVEETLIESGFERGRGTVLLERAHLNSKLSLIAIEARLRLAEAATARQADFLLGHTKFQHDWERLGFDMALGMRNRDAAWRDKFLAITGGLLPRIRAGAALLATHQIAIAGPVNAGKSTLSNLLAREQRHIVSPIPGTTLDRLETPVAIRGLNVLLSDTAGIREPSGNVEQEGQRRGRDAADKADLRLIVLDGSKAPSDSDMALIEKGAELGRTMLVLNKSDLGIDSAAGGLGFLAGQEPLLVSAQTGAGLDELERAIESALLEGDGPAPHTPFTRRQIDLVERLHAGLLAGADANELLVYLRKLVGTRPNPAELAVVLAE